MALESKGKRIVLFEDEAGFSLHPKLGRVWAKKGSKPFVYTRSQHQKRLNIYGWVDPINGLHGIMKWISGNTDGFIQLLRKITYRLKGKTINIWVDNAKWHKGRDLYCRAFFSSSSLSARLSPGAELSGMPMAHPAIRGNDQCLFRDFRRSE